MRAVVLRRLQLEKQMDGFSHRPGQHSNTDKGAEGGTSRGPQSWKRRKQQPEVYTTDFRLGEEQRDPDVGVVMTA